MKKIILALLGFTLFASSTFAQINAKDSTVQIIGFWSKNDKQSFSVSSRKMKIKGADTTLTLNTMYDVDITVVDSTAKNFILRWDYKNMRMSPETPITKALMSINDSVSTLVRTNEMGVFEGVENWQEIAAYVQKMAPILKTQLASTPNIDKIVDQIIRMFSTKEAIETAVSKEVRQFHNFHGGKYKLGEQLSDSIKLPNITGGAPFDAIATVSFDEMDVNTDNVVMRYWHIIDENQLREAAYTQVLKLLSGTDKPAPKLEDIGEMKNEMQIASRIHGSTGWVIYSIQTHEVSANGITSVDESVIEMK